MIDNKTLGTDVYTDFSGFESMRKAARDNNPDAIGAVAKQLEGMFLKMMLSSMREANQIFSEDSLLSSKEVRFYEQMLDQQLTTTLSEGKGLGLADSIERQLSAIQGRRYDPDAPSTTDSSRTTPDDTADSTLNSLERYRVMAVPPMISVPPGSGADQEIENRQKMGDKKPIPLSKQYDEFTPVSPREFVERILPYARRSASELGVPVESIVAQAALETGWGRYSMKHEDGRQAFNLFGIKADKHWQGDSVNVMTLEYRNGIAAKEPAAFRSYASLDEAFTDYTQFLSQKDRYQNALQQIRDNQDAKSWGTYLQQAGYATDPDYGKKIASIVARLQKDGASQERLNISRAP